MAEARAVSAACWREARVRIPHRTMREDDADDDFYTDEFRQRVHDGCMRRQGFMRAPRSD